MNRRYTFEEVFDLDDALYKLALYEVTEGKMSTLISHEELMDVHLKCAEKFNYFKGLIQRGECTIAYLKDTVLFKNGPYYQHDYVDTPEKLVNKLDSDDANCFDEDEDGDNSVSSFYNKLGEIIQDMSRKCEAQEGMGEELQITDSTTTPKSKTKRAKKKKEE